jgi:hypothetical protein
MAAGLFNFLKILVKGEKVLPVADPPFIHYEPEEN